MDPSQGMRMELEMEREAVRGFPSSVGSRERRGCQGYYSGKAILKFAKLVR